MAGSAGLRVLVGLLTTGFFLVAGGSLLLGERWYVGGAIVALGLYRAWFLARDVRWLLTEDDDEDGVVD